MSALEEAIANLEWGNTTEAWYQLDRAKAEVDRLVEMLTEVRAIIQSPSRLAERIDAALVPFERKETA